MPMAAETAIFDPDEAVRRYRAHARALMDKIMRMVESHVDAPRQRSAEWLAAKRHTVGGSEIATLLGLNPYSSPVKMLASKAGLDKFAGGVACWWGTMFEAVSEDLVARAFDTRVVGTDIHIRSEALPAHANSPDGYAVIAFSRPRTGDGAVGDGAVGDEAVADEDDGDSGDGDGDGDGPTAPWQMCFNPEAAAAAGDEVMALPALIELKAPYSRLPKGEVPKYYTPQLLSGMALSPAAAVGLYVEVVYRLCTLDQLAPGSPDYASNYHSKDARAVAKNGGRPLWPAPAALGLTAVYAPRLGTRRQRQASVRLGEKGADQLALEVLVVACGMSVELVDGELADLGAVADDRPSRFDAVLGQIDRGELRTQHSHPFDCDGADGGAAAENELRRFMAVVEAAPPPEHYYLLGYIPWKVFQADFHIVQKDPDYMEVIREPVESFVRDLEAILAAEDVRAAYHQHVAAGAPPPEERERRTGNAGRLAGLMDMFMSA